MLTCLDSSGCSSPPMPGSAYCRDHNGLVPAEDETVLQIVFTAEDVRSMANEHGIDFDLALERVRVWRRYIEGTMSEYCTEQMISVVKNNEA